MQTKHEKALAKEAQTLRDRDQKLKNSLAEVERLSSKVESMKVESDIKSSSGSAGEK
jgi:hypothetical protein